MSSEEIEIFKTVASIYPKLQQILQQKHPELLPLYLIKFNYVLDDRYPLLVRLHNAYQILRAYCQLLKQVGY